MTITSTTTTEMENHRTMSEQLHTRTSLITGGGVGIGAEIALAFAGAGARVAITYRTHPPSEQFAARIKEASGSPLTALHLDATSEEEVQKACAAVRDEFDQLDILVNNIGGLIQRRPIAEMNLSLWRTVMAVNLDSAFLTTHYALPFITRGRGRIINVASLAGHNGGHSGATAYASSKAALFGFTRGLAKEVAPEGITVNALAPGFIEATPFHDTFTTDEAKQATIQTIPIGRAGTPADVAGPAVWLASDQSAFVTGTTIDINGGQYFG